MEVATEINVLLNLATAGLVAYTAHTLRHLRVELRRTAAEVRQDLEDRHGPNGGFHRVG